MPHYASFRSKVYDLSQLLTKVLQYVLCIAHSEKEPLFCLCSDNPQKLYVRRYGDTYGVCTYADTAHLHDTGCPCYAAPGEVERRRALRRGLAAIQEVDGHTVVALTNSLFAPTHQREDAKAPTIRTGASSEPLQARTSLPAFLDYAIYQGHAAIANDVPVNDASFSSFSRPFLQGLPSTIINGVPGNEVVLVPSLTNQRHFDAGVHELLTMPHRGMRKLVFGHVTRVGYADPIHYALQLEYTNVRLDIEEERWLRILRHSASQNAERAEEDLRLCVRPQRLLMMALVEGAPNGRLSIVSAAVRVTTAHFVPVDSTYELDAYSAIRKAGLRFQRPTKRLDWCGGFVPDGLCWLTPSGPTLIEIAGLDDREYLAHLVEKLEKYVELDLPVWVWFAFTGERMPPLSPQDPEVVLDRARKLLAEARVRPKGRKEK